jgi:putative phosphoesterase
MLFVMEFFKESLMKIGIVSDTHRNKELLHKAVDWMVNRQKISALYHLGDDYDDVNELGDLFVEIVQVPGTYDERYKNGTLPKKLSETVLGVTMLLVHQTDKDLTDDDLMTTDIILHGHTHKEEIHLEDGKLFFNPGHLKGPMDKNMPPTFGMLTIGDNEVTATIYNMDFKVVQSVDLLRSESGLYKE